MCLVRDNDHEKNPARETCRKLNQLSQQVLDDTYAMMIRLACVKNDLVVINPQQKGHDGVDKGKDKESMPLTMKMAVVMEIRPWWMLADPMLLERRIRPIQRTYTKQSALLNW